MTMQMPITFVFVEPDGAVRSMVAPPVGSLMQAALAPGSRPEPALRL